MTRGDCLYASHYCEENVYKLCSHPVTAKRNRTVVFISNSGRSVAMRSQRASSGIVMWDYHVILMVDTEVLDLDTTLGFPAPVSTYFDHSFPTDVPSELRPRFRVVAAQLFLDTFHSDRSHMIGADGLYLAAPPPWPAIRPELGSNLDEFVDMSRDSSGEVLSLSGMMTIVARAG